jgi:hypothetical protein
MEALDARVTKEVGEAIQFGRISEYPAPPDTVVRKGQVIGRIETV